MEATNMPDNESDLRSRVVNLEHTAAANVQRLTSIESRLVKYDIDDARKDEQERIEQTEQEIADYEKKLAAAGRSCLLNSDDIEWMRK